MEKIELLDQSQRLLGIPPSQKPTVLGSEGYLPPPVPTGRLLGGIYLKITKVLEDKKCQVLTTVFSNDAVPLCFPTRLRLELRYQ